MNTNMNSIKENFSKNEMEQISKLSNSKISMSFIETISENVWRFNEYAIKIDGMVKNVTVYFNDKLKYVAYSGNTRQAKSEEVLSLIAQKILNGVNIITKMNVYGDTPLYSCAVVDHRRKIWKDFIIMKRSEIDDLAIEELRPLFKIPEVDIIDINLRQVISKTESVKVGSFTHYVKVKKCPILLDVQHHGDKTFTLMVMEEIGALKSKVLPVEKIALFDGTEELFSTSDMNIEKFIKVVPKLVQNIY